MSSPTVAQSETSNQLKNLTDYKLSSIAVEDNLFVTCSNLTKKLYHIMSNTAIDNYTKTRNTFYKCSINAINVCLSFNF